jgi:hypothetical protein
MAWICGHIIPAEALGLNGAEDNRNVENARGFREHDVVVDDGLAVEIGDAKQHLGLKVDDRYHAVIGREQSLFAALGTTRVI